MKKNTKHNEESGFTLIELMVTVGIMMLVMSVVMTNHNTFGGKILLRTLAYDMALSVRQSQTYGISVRRTAENTFVTGYGMHYDIATPTNYVMFADTYKLVGGIPTLVLPNEVGNSLYDTSLESVQIFSIGRGYKINKLCVTDTVEKCNNTPGTPVNTIDIVFKRPEPDASIRINGAVAAAYRRARVELKSPRGDLKNVIIEVTGQISVQ